MDAMANIMSCLFCSISSNDFNMQCATIDAKYIMRTVQFVGPSMLCRHGELYGHCEVGEGGVKV